VGPTITEPVVTYTPSVTAVASLEKTSPSVLIFPNPSNDVLVVQSMVAWNLDRKVELVSSNGKVVRTDILRQGSTMCYFDTQTLHAGIYMVRIVTPSGISQVTKVVIGE
jgi:hypothetical protein